MGREVRRVPADWIHPIMEGPPYLDGSTRYQPKFNRSYAQAKAEWDCLVAERDALQARVAELETALVWCGGSSDFCPGGIAREGWMKVCAPLLQQPKP